MAYRDEFNERLKQCSIMHPKILAQELNVWNKLWSILDENMVNKVEADVDWDFVNSSKQPSFLRRLIIDAASEGVGGSQRIENIRERWVNFTMQNQTQSLQSHKKAFEELCEQSLAAGIHYSDAEKVNKFVKSLSDRWVQKRAEIDAMPDALKPRNINAAVEALTTWATAQERNYGVIGYSSRTYGEQYAAYVVRKDNVLEKVDNPCFNFKKGNGCKRGDGCKFLHDTMPGRFVSDDAAAVAVAEATGAPKAKDGRPICLACGGVINMPLSALLSRGTKPKSFYIFVSYYC